MLEQHAGNELKLMLEAVKPLAMFYYCRAFNDKDLVPIADFAPHVAEGLIVMEEFDPPMPSGTKATYQTTFVLYPLAAEAWRIPAMKIALTAQNENLRSPDEGIDRIIGMLLGYPKAEIDAWIQSGSESGTYK